MSHDNLDQQFEPDYCLVAQTLGQEIGDGEPFATVGEITTSIPTPPVQIAMTITGPGGDTLAVGPGQVVMSIYAV